MIEVGNGWDFSAEAYVGREGEIVGDDVCGSSLVALVGCVSVSSEISRDANEAALALKIDSSELMDPILDCWSEGNSSEKRLGGFLCSSGNAS